MPKRGTGMQAGKPLRPPRARKAPAARGPARPVAASVFRFERNRQRPAYDLDLTATEIEPSETIEDLRKP